MEFLCISVVVIGMVALVGHGIWLFFAALLRGFQPPEEPARPDRPRVSEVDELEAALRQVRGLMRREEVDQATGQRLFDALLARRRALLGEPAPEPAAVPRVRVAPPPMPALVRPTLHNEAELPEVLPVEQPKAPPPKPVEPPPPPPPPRRPLTDVLTAFMEDRNILWGELVGGLLIVGCSIALVLSLWQKLADIPYFPFLLFSVLTGSLFAAGQYTLHHWKLATTSRGLLLISLLLVPLNLLILADLSLRGDTTRWLDSIVALVAVGLSAGLVRATGRDLIGVDLLPGPVDRRWLLALGVVGTAGTALVWPFLGDVADNARLISFLAVGWHLLVCGALMGGLTLYGGREQRLTAPQTHAIFSFLGAGTFAVLATLGYLLTKLHFAQSELRLLAEPILLVGVPGLALGLLVFRRLADDQPQGLRLAGTSVALAGMALMLAGVVFAWPMATALTGTLALMGVVLAVAAFPARVPWALAGAVPALTVAVVLLCSLVTGTLPTTEASSAQLWQALTTAHASVLLAAVCVVLTGLASWLMRTTWVDHGVTLARAALAMGVVALLVVTGQVNEHPLIAAGVHGAMAITAAVASLRWGRSDLAHAAMLTLVPATLWALWGCVPEQRQWWGVTFAVETLLLGVAAIGLRRTVTTLATAGERVALLTGGLAIAFAVTSGNFAWDATHGATMLLLSGAMAVRARDEKNAWWFTGFQVGMTATVVCAVTALTHRYGWWHDSVLIPSYGIGLGLLCLAWTLARRAWPGELWHAFTPGFDRWTLGFVGCATGLLACAVAVGGVAAEYGATALTEVMPVVSGVSSPWGWGVVGILGVTLILLLGDREATAGERREAQVGLLLLFLITPLLWAGMHSIDVAGASALRWGLAACFVVGSALVWQRERLAQLASAIGLHAASTTTTSYGLLACAGVVVVALTAILTGLGFSGTPLPGPTAESLFAQLGPRLSSIGPLLLLIVGLVGTAVRERWPGYALSAGLLAPVSVVGGYALGVVQSGSAFDVEAMVFTALLGCQTSAIVALLWLTAQRWIGGGWTLAVQAWLGLAGLIVLTGLFVPELFLQLRQVDEAGYVTLGSGAGALALVVTLLAAAWFAWREQHRQLPHVAALGVWLTGVQVGCHAHAWDATIGWVSYHVLVGWFAAVAGSLTLVGSLLSSDGKTRLARYERATCGWLSLLALLLTLLALRGAVGPLPYEFVPAAAVLTASVLMGAVALWFLRGGFAHASGLLFTLAVFLGWVVHGSHEPIHWLLVIATGLATSASFWWAIEMPWLSRGLTRLRWRSLYAPIATVVALLLVIGVAVVAVAGDATGVDVVTLQHYGLIPLGVVAVALALTVQAGWTRTGLGGLYMLGLALAGLVLHELSPKPPHLMWMGLLALATHAGLAGLAVRLWQAWTVRPPIADSPLSLRDPVIPERQWAWFFPAQVAIGCLVCVLAISTAIAQDTLSLRLVGPAGIALLIAPAWWMARAQEEPGRESLRLTALTLGVLALGAVAWAIPDPTAAIPWLTRNAWLLVALTASSVAGLELLHGWPAARRLALALGGLACVLAAILLGQMIPVFNPHTRQTPLDELPIAAIALSIVALSVTAIRLALRGDPLGWSDSARTFYVYLAELLVVFLFMHVRLNVPALFTGTLAKYWTFVVLGAACGIVGLGEWSERRGLRVLAIPLLRTGVLLPIVPILAFWAQPAAQAMLGFAGNHAPGLLPFLENVANLPQNYVSYAGVWFLASALYAVLALARRSTWWSLVAALAANFGLWALLMHAGIGFLVHPQAWIIPLAMILLVAEHLHRDKLSGETGQALRYLGITLIYVASTADLFLVGIGESVWLPIVLAVLCVVGVLAGIVLQVRAFLFLGVGFLLVDVLTMIWYAAARHAQTWMWWASGIVLGVAILALFTLFEKRRNDVLRIVDQLRTWD